MAGMVDPNRVMEKVPPYSTWNSNRALATSFTLTGPTSGSNGVASTAFTVALPEGVAVQFPVTITPADAGTGNAGVFTPTSVILQDAPNAERSKTFTYTPGSTGVKAISVTNNGGLTNPSGINYTSS